MRGRSIRWHFFAATALSMVCASAAVADGEPSVEGYRLLDMQRLSRFEYLLEYDALLHNPGPPLELGADAELTVDNPAATVLDGTLQFGPLGTGERVRSSDGFLIRHDRHLPLREGELRWTIRPRIGVGINRAPTIDSAPPGTVEAGRIYRYPVAATDPDPGNALTYRLDVAPSGMSIDASGLVRWTPDAFHVGAHTVRVQVHDRAGASAEQSYTLRVGAPSPRPPAITSFPPQTVHLGEDYDYALHAVDPDGDLPTYGLVQAPAGMTVNPASGLVRWRPEAPGIYAVEASATDPGGLRGVQAFSLRVEATAVPADPAPSAPALEPSGGVFADGVRFLFEGPGAVQTDLQPGALEERRVAVLRGRVLEREGGPLPGARVEVVGAPDLGHTLSRADGWVDLVTNGGAELLVRYSKSGYLPVQRLVNVPAEDYAVLPEVSLTRLDPLGTEVLLGEAATEVQLVMASPVDDGDGARRAAVLIPPGTRAHYTRADGSEAVLDRMTVRATEYTVGPAGVQAMPGELPAGSGYTYAVELSADEVLADGVKISGKDVHFDRPVPVYVDNFIGFPVGGVVPVGYYDNDAARWVASDNGRVVKLLGIVHGLAALDLDGSGTPADTAALAAEGITDPERERLAAAYAPGAELWRFQVRHFSTWDCNWPYGPPDDAEPPPPLQCSGGGGPSARGSDIRVGAGTLSERIELPGTGQSLVYNSARRSLVRLEQPLNDGRVHPSLKRLEYQVSIAGQVTSGKVANPAPGQAIRFEWNGRDAYGREMKAPVTARARIENIYHPVRYAPARLGRVFGTFMNLMANPQSRGANAIALRGDRTRFEIGLGSESSLTVGAARRVDAGSTFGTGELNLSGLPLLDPRRGVRVDGGGGVSAGAPVLQTPIGPALTDPHALADDGAGGLLAAGAGGIYRIADGQPRRLPGSERFVEVRRVRTGRGGEVLVLGRIAGDGLGPRLWSLAPDGEIRLLAGSGETGCDTLIRRGGEILRGLPFWDPEGGITADPAGLRLSDPSDIAVGRDGSVYLADARCHLVYWLRPGGGDVYVIAGDGTDRVHTAGGPAGGLSRPPLARPLSLALDARGNLFIGTANGLVRRWGPDGWIETVAGNGEIGFAGDGDSAMAARFGAIDALVAGPDGSLYLDDSRDNGRLRRIDPRGRVETLAGTGTADVTPDGLTAAGAAIGRLAGMGLDAERRIHFAERAHGAATIRRIASAYAALPGQDGLRVAEGDGTLIEFDAAGRPLATFDAGSGAPRQSMRYDAAGRLSAIADADGRETRFERDAAGRIAAVLGASGARSAIAYNAFGLPVRVTQPDGTAWGLDYDARGLLTRFTDPNGQVTTFAYDSLGRLVRDTDAAGGGWRIEHDPNDAAGDSAAQTVRYTSAEGRIHVYSADTDPATGIRTSVTRAPDGGETLSVTDALARRSETRAADGSLTVTEMLPSAAPPGAPPDSRTTLTLPSGLRRTSETRGTWALADPADPASWVRVRQVRETNGNPWVSTFDPASGISADTSPEGRITSTRNDARGRVVRTQTAGLAPVEYRYDERGLLIETRQGEGAQLRTTSYAYDALEHVQAVTDPEGRTTGFETDAAGRVLRITRPDGATVGFAYDAKGNLLGLTPPGRTEHSMDYSPVDLETGYTPPPLDEGTGPIATAYNKDRDLTRRAHALGPAIDYAYDHAGRLTARTTPEGSQTYTYMDGTNRAQSITTPAGERLDFSYDGPLPTSVQWSGSINGRVDTEWGADLLPSAQVVNDALRIDYAYDRDGLLTAAGALRLTRLPEHGAVSATALGQIGTQRAFNAFGETQEETADFATLPLYQVRYTRDRLGRITEKVETLEGVSRTFAYAYDAAGRLVEERTDGQLSGAWAYDPNGNRIAQNGQTAGTYDPQDRMTIYDLRTHRRPTPRGAIDYLIDGQDRRIGKRIDGTLVQGFLYLDALNPIAELNEEGTVLSLFVYGEKPNVPDAMIKIDPDTGAQTTYRILSDHLGSPRLVVNTDTGEIAQRLDYDAWGVLTHDSNPGFQPFGFAGGLYDTDTGLVRFGARDYDPVTGRWMGKDPIGFGSGEFNLYGYVLADPVNKVDPLGLVSQFCTRWFYPSPVPYARHCYIQFDDGDSIGFGPDGVGPDAAPDWWPGSCSSTEGDQNDDCVRREMGKCTADQYDFMGFNCCHCVEQAMKSCGLSIPLDTWPNWPVNPGPQPGEPGYRP